MSPQPQQSQKKILNTLRKASFLLQNTALTVTGKKSHATPTAVLTYLLAFIKITLNKMRMR